MTNFAQFEGTIDSTKTYYGLNALRNLSGTFIIFPAYKFLGHIGEDNSLSGIINYTSDVLRHIVHALTSNILRNGSNIDSITFSRWH